MSVTAEQWAQAEAERQRQAELVQTSHQRSPTIGDGTEQQSAGDTEAEG